LSALAAPARSRGRLGGEQVRPHRAVGERRTTLDEQSVKHEFLAMAATAAATG
jgi:hypothetical protein